MVLINKYKPIRDRHQIRPIIIDRVIGAREYKQRFDKFLLLLITIVSCGYWLLLLLNNSHHCLIRLIIIIIKTFGRVNRIVTIIIATKASTSLLHIRILSFATGATILRTIHAQRAWPQITRHRTHATSRHK